MSHSSISIGASAIANERDQARPLSRSPISTGWSHSFTLTQSPMMSHHARPPDRESDAVFLASCATPAIQFHIATYNAVIDLLSNSHLLTLFRTC